MYSVTLILVSFVYVFQICVGFQHETTPLLYLCGDICQGRGRYIVSALSASVVISNHNSHCCHSDSDAHTRRGGLGLPSDFACTFHLLVTLWRRVSTPPHKTPPTYIRWCVRSGVTSYFVLLLTHMRGI